MSGRGDIMCFDFRIIVCLDGTEIIDRKQKTFYHQLTPVQMIEYIEIDTQLAIMDRMHQKARAGMRLRRKGINRLLWKIARSCGFCE